MPCESSEARIGRLTWVSGQRPEQGADATFFCNAKDVGTRPLPCTVSFCHSRAAVELIRLTVHLSLRFGSPVDSPVVAGCWKLIRLSARLSCRLSSPFTQLGGSDAHKHTRKAGHFPRSW